MDYVPCGLLSSKAVLLAVCLGQAKEEVGGEQGRAQSLLAASLAREQTLTERAVTPLRECLLFGLAGTMSSPAHHLLWPSALMFF